MRLFRPFFFATAAFMLMPAPPESELASAGMRVSAPDLFSAAAGTVSDMGSFCARQPGVCETAGYVAAHMEARAKYGVLLIYRWANEAQDTPLSEQAQAADPIATGSLKHIAAAKQNTLRLEDYIPEWRGPNSTRKG